MTCVASSLLAGIGLIANCLPGQVQALTPTYSVVDPAGLFDTILGTGLPACMIHVSGDSLTIDISFQPARHYNSRPVPGAPQPAMPGGQC